MADKNITLRQKNTSGVYDKLYTKTTATQSKLSTATAALFGDGTSDADAALAKIADTVKSIGNVQVKVVDPSGNPIQGARITGLYGTPTTASDGTAHGVLQTNPISISSPYIDLKDQTADASGYVGSFNALVVTLPIVGENGIVRVTSSKTVKFSKAVKTVDVCCVGGGGGGGNLIITSSGAYTYEHVSGGGGGGAIVNSYGKSINADTDYTLSVGSGGASGYTGGTGGTTTFLSVSAPGGGGAYVDQPSSSIDPIGKGGSAGSPGSGKGGDYGHNGENSTISEFDDGVTFYSGGGGSGNNKGGTPNGADGAYITGGYPGTSTPHAASTSGIGGGGGGATYGNQISADLPSAGGPGLVAIRFHF